ncbi:MAG: hypothetical protein GX308_01465 [Epulopiscium sp.]|nr:hypothetical protein [Candidatus Epulonipiscium sp.]
MAEIVKEHNINKKSKAPFIIVTVSFLIILIAVGIIIRFNIGNVTEKYLRNTLEKVPIVNNLLPPKNEEGDKYANISKEQLVKESKELQKKIEDKEQFINIYKDNIEKLEAEITRLKEIENQQIQYKEDERKFSEMVALEDPKGFIEFFKNTHPDTAAEIYERLIGEEIEIQKIKKYAQPFQTMDPSDAAKVLEEMVGTDMDLVVLLLNNIDSEQQAAILGEMNPQKAARVVKSMAPN